MKNSFFSFDGRIGRIYFFGYHVLGSILFSIAYTLNANNEFYKIPSGAGFLLPLACLSIIFSLVGWWIQLAGSVKRLHDLNMSGWWYLVYLIPIVDIIFFFYLLLAPGDKGPNKYGIRENL